MPLESAQNRGYFAPLGWFPTCAPQKVDPALIARFGPAMFVCFWPILFLRITTVVERTGEERKRRR